MSSPLSEPHPSTPERIDSSLPADVRYWRTLFGCTELELLAAVQEVGPLVEDVRRYLGGPAEQLNTPSR